MEEIQKAINMLDQLRIDITKVENDDKVENDAYEIQQLLFKALDKVEKLPIHSVVNCKHENYTPYYGREGELMEKRCDDCEQDID